jgi:large subunit ribosomal protein L21
LTSTGRRVYFRAFLTGPALRPRACAPRRAFFILRAGHRDGRGTRSVNAMYAVIKTGGKQYKVAVDQVVEIEKLEGDAGTKVQFGEVLLFGNGEGVSKVGVPFLAGATVEGEIVAQGKADKILIVKKKRRQNYRRKNGHRQPFTRVKITSIAA